MQRRCSFSPAPPSGSPFRTAPAGAAFQVSAPGKAATRYVVSLNGEGRSFNSGSYRGGWRPRQPRRRDGEIGRARRLRVTSKTLLSGGCVLTLGAKTPNYTVADVLIDGSMVAEVGRNVAGR